MTESDSPPPPPTISPSLDKLPPTPPSAGGASHTLCREPWPCLGGRIHQLSKTVSTRSSWHTEYHHWRCFSVNLQDSQDLQNDT